jgi:hypothetical protein
VPFKIILTNGDWCGKLLPQRMLAFVKELMMCNENTENKKKPLPI